MARNTQSETASKLATASEPATASQSATAPEPGIELKPAKSSYPVTLPLPIFHPGIPPDVPKRFHVLLGVTGSVASLKLPLLISKLLKIPEVEVRVVTTEHAKQFYSVEGISVPLYSDSDEWQMWKQRSDPVLHIELRRWASVMVICPLDANTLAKLSHGICDNLLTCVVRAWDLKKPLLFCPAMNTAMWEHPVTQQHVNQLKTFGYTEVSCISKKLICGDEGRGAMAEVETIVEKVRSLIPEKEVKKSVLAVEICDHCGRLIE